MDRTLEIVKSELLYERSEGVHTFSMCACSRRGRRAYKCRLCLEEEITALTERKSNG